MKGLIAKKVGMTQVFDDNGNLTPVTVIRIEPNTVVATKTKEKCGYEAVVLGLDDMKKGKANKAYAKQFPENISPKRHLKEFRDFDNKVSVGDQIGVELFDKSGYVDVTATSKGKTATSVAPQRAQLNIRIYDNSKSFILSHSSSLV